MYTGLTDTSKKPNPSEVVVTRDIPGPMMQEADERREELLEMLYEVDDTLAELVVAEERKPTPAEIKAAIKRATIARKFCPVLMGSAYKNKGVQPLLDSVVEFLPDPTQVYVSSSPQTQ